MTNLRKLIDKTVAKETIEKKKEDRQQIRSFVDDVKRTHPDWFKKLQKSSGLKPKYKQHTKNSAYVQLGDLKFEVSHFSFSIDWAIEKVNLEHYILYTHVNNNGKKKYKHWYINSIYDLQKALKEIDELKETIDNKDIKE